MELSFKDKLANALGPEYVKQLEVKRTKNDSGRDLDTVRSCGLCGRENLVGHTAFWAHLKGRHTEDIEKMLNSKEWITSESERFEDTLVRICNALTLEEACELATTALLGDTLHV